MERVIFIIALVLLGVIGIVIVLKPMFTIKLILRFFVPGYHMTKDRQRRVPWIKSKKEEEVRS